jgi:hypothetical protein
MNKKTKMWLGVGVVAAAAYYFWNKSKSAPAATTPAVAKFVGADAVFANQSGKCPAGYTESKNSNKVWVCDNGKGHRYRSA